MSIYKSLIYGCAICCLSFSVQAKVCFLGSNDASCSTSKFNGFTGCPGYTQCSFPKQNAVSAEATCGENYANWYKSSDCCSSNYTLCEAPKECKSTKCVSSTKTAVKYGYLTAAQRNSYCSKLVRPTDAEKLLNTTCNVPSTLCEPKSCKCPSTYGVCPSGTVGVGLPCNDGGVDKYQSCKCPDTYVKCSDYSNTHGSGTACQDVEYASGMALYSVYKYTQCLCDTPDTGYGDWANDELKCSKACDTCQRYVNGETETFYSCRTVTEPTCKCAVMTDSEGCSVGCTDSNWDYVGSILDHVKWLLKEKSPVSAGVCGALPCCEAGSWDKSDYATDTASFCQYLGYTANATSTSTTLKYICLAGQTALKCPFNLKYYACAGHPATASASTATNQSLPSTVAN